MTLAHLKDEAPVIVGLPRGGIPVAFEGANALNAPLDLALVRKIGAPGQPKLAIGAMVDDGIATGTAMRVATVGFAARGRDAPRRRLPVAPLDTAGAHQSDGDEFVCLFAPKVFEVVGSFYEDCSQTLDEAVIAPLDQAMKRQAADSPHLGQVKSYEKSDLFS